MLPRVCSGAVLVVLLAFAAGAEPSQAGDPFPLAATRYGTARGHDPLLLSNGRDPVIFWTDDQVLRAARFANGRFGVSRVVGDNAYDALWTGRHFLVVSAPYQGGIHGRLLDADGAPLGEPFLIAERGFAPRIAFNGSRVLMLFTSIVFPNDFQLHALTLTPDGHALEATPRPLGVAADGKVALASNGDSFAALVPNVNDPTFLFFDASGALRSSRVFHEHGSGVAIATDGRRYLGIAACAEGKLCMPAVSRVIEPDGTVAAPVVLDQPHHTNPSVIWNGTNWVISYLRDAYLQEAATLQVVQLDAAARLVERRQERPAVEASLGVVGTRALVAWTAGRYRDTVVVGPVPFDDSTSIPASITANDQNVVGLAASSRGTLVVWSERGNARTTLHTGFRTVDGSWSEREIASNAPRECFVCYEEPFSVMVAGDGEEFLLHISGADGHQLRRLDANGNVTGEPIALPFFPGRMLWTGAEYLVFHGDREFSRMTRAGTITTTGVLPPIVGQSYVFATDGNGGVIAVRVDRTIINHEPRIAGLSVIRLDRNLNPIDATPIRLAIDDQALYAPSAGWDGRQYVVAWSGSEGIMAAQIAPSGAANPKVVKLAPGRATEILIEPVPGAAAILWNEVWAANHLSFLAHGGAFTPPMRVGEPDTRGAESGRIAPLSNGDLAYVESSLQPAEPFGGTAHVMMRIISAAALPQKPDAPRLAVQLLASNEAVLTWTAPPQPVDGFRLETRIDDGPWIELAPPLDRDARATRVTLIAGSRYVFRLRAWNEAGAGAYAAAPGTRRRSARN
ncbi:MAG TPA: fibronectin type III domain-containing protein [Thermoanaerobaculia bacterium]|nr:fibronectin type III domain-containing protein [Thermoanaerobaculia bacterium]